jgi:hypothetical protein
VEKNEKQKLIDKTRFPNEEPQVFDDRIPYELIMNTLKRVGDQEQINWLEAEKEKRAAESKNKTTKDA